MSPTTTDTPNPGKDQLEEIRQAIRAQGEQLEGAVQSVRAQLEDQSRQLAEIKEQVETAVDLLKSL